MLRRAAHWGLALACLLAAWQAGRLGIADEQSRQAYLEIERWTASARRGSLAPVEERLRASLRFAASNPEALNLLGGVALAWMREARTPEAARRAAAEARDLFRRGLHERPASPFLWANLALAKIYLDEPDEEMLGALHRADALGPWEPRVQEAVVFAGLSAWTRLDPRMRESLARTVERAARRNPHPMLEILKGYGRLDLACRHERFRRIAGTECIPTHNDPTRKRR